MKTKTPAQNSRPIGDMLKEVAAQRTQKVAAEREAIISKSGRELPAKIVTGLELLEPFVGIDPLATALVQCGFTQQERIERLVNIFRTGSDKDALKAERSLNDIIVKTMQLNGGYAELSEKQEHVNADGTVVTRTTSISALRSTLAAPLPAGGAERIIEPVRPGVAPAGLSPRRSRPPDGGGGPEAPEGSGHQGAAADGPIDPDRVGPAQADGGVPPAE